MTEPVTAPPTEPAATTEPPKPTLADSLSTLDEDTRKFVLGEVEKARSEAKGLRTRIKDLEPQATELARIKAEQQTAEQRAQQAADQAAQKATDTLHKAAKVALKAALTGVVDDPGGVLDDLNVAKFVTDDGEIDEDAVTALRERYAALGGGKPRTPAPNLAQGGTGQPALQPRDMFAALVRGAA